MIEDEYYKKYLYDMLDLIFNDNGSITLNNLSLDNNAKDNNEEKPEYTLATDFKYRDTLVNYPEKINYIKGTVYDAVKLPNGIIGINYNHTNTDWYFPELDFLCSCNKDTIRQFNDGFFSIGGNLFNSVNKLVYKYEKGFDSDYRALGMHYEYYSDYRFILKSSYGDDEGILIDGQGNKFLRKSYRGYTPYYTLTSRLEDPLDEYNGKNYVVKKQCTLIPVGRASFDGTIYDRYLVYLKNNTFLNNKTQYSIASEKDGILLLWHKEPAKGYYRSYSGSNYLVAITENGKPLNDGKEIAGVKKIGNNFIVVKDSIYYMVYNKNGKLLCDKRLRNINNYVRRGDDYLYIGGKATDGFEYAFDCNGYLFGGKAYDQISVISENYAKIRDGKEYKIIDKKGNVIHNNKSKPYGEFVVCNNVLIEGNNRLIIVRNKKLEQANIKKSIFGYRLTINNKNYNIKYIPVLIYGDEQVLCISNQKEYYIYNCSNNSYKKIGYITNINYNELFIVFGNRYYLPYKNKLLDINDYYKEKLKDKDRLTINPYIGDIDTKEEFVDKNKIKLMNDQMEIDKNNERIRKEQEEAKRLLEEKLAIEREEREKLLAQQAQEKLLREKQEKQREEKRRKELLYNEYLSKIKELNIDVENKVPISSLDFYVDCSDHFEISDQCKDFLDTIDLSKESFKDVKVSGLNFVGSNANFNPQNVYKKDISDCDLSGIYFSPFTIFTGVNIKGTKLSFDNDRSTIDIFNSTIKYAIYDDRTTINNMSVNEYINEMLMHKSNNR